MTQTINWLATRGAGLVFEASFSPLDPAIDPLGLSARVKPYQHVRSPNGKSRHLFDSYPKTMVKKIRKRGGSDVFLGTLALETKKTVRYSAFYQFFDQEVSVATTLALDGGLITLTSDSSYWIGGQDKLHVSATLYQNEDVGNYYGDDPPKQYYRNRIFSYSFDYNDTNTILVGVTEDYTQTRQGTTFTPWVGNGGTFENHDFEEQEFFCDFSEALVKYTDVLGTTLVNTNFTKKARPRLSDQDPLGLSQYVEVSEGYPDDGYIFYVNEIATFEGEDDWIVADEFLNIKVDCRFVYETPDTCEECWYVGTTVELKIKYKQAELTRLFTMVGDLGVWITEVGTFSEHSEVTKTVTLPGSAEGFQNLGDVFEVPQEKGKMIAIDDIEVVSVTMPGD